METASVRAGHHGDADDFAELALYSGPELLPALFGPTVRQLWRNAFHHERSCFSFEHSRFIEVNGCTTGMALAYSYERKRKEELRSLMLILRYLGWRFPPQAPCLLRSGGIIAQIGEGDYYLSSIAVRPEARCLGRGARLLEGIEAEARNTGAARMVLDVETDNDGAMRWYERLGYAVQLKSPVLRTKDRDFEFFQMVKPLVNAGAL